jgi:protein-disulfide isomerase|tara:strand:+ start:3482 stop:3631 length:150 start_codon:yes stop_codon:yes gene_type:complete
MKQEVQADASYGSQIGVSGTPTFFINGIKLVGAQPYEAFKQVIESELSN